MNRSTFGRLALTMIIVLLLAGLLTLTVLAATLDPTFSGDGVVWSEYGYLSMVRMQGEKIVARDGDSIFGKKLARFNGDGSLDRTFGTDGEVLVKHRVYDFTIQPDGKIVAAGSMKIDRDRYLAVTRYNRNGTPDETFGEGGTVITEVRWDLYDNFFNDVVIQPDGKILAGGGSGQQLIHSWEGYPVLVRYLPDGTPDKSFGDMGVAILYSTWMQTVRHIGLQYDDRIIISGYTRHYSYTTEPQEVVIARHHFDGRLDQSFGDNGLKKIGEGNLDDMLLQPDEKIVLLGSFESSGAGMARFHSDGTWDEGFGEGGIVRIPYQYYGAARGMVMQKDGRILLAGVGRLEEEGDGDRVMLARFDPDGSLDRSFGENGRVLVNVDGTSDPDRGRALTLQPDNKIIVAGTSAYRAILLRFANVEGPELSPTITPSPSPSPTNTFTPSPTITATATATATPTGTATATPTSAPFPSPSPTNTATAAATATATPTGTATPAPSATPSFTPTSTPTPVASETPTPESSEDHTPTPVAPETPTPESSEDPTATAGPIGTTEPTAEPLSPRSNWLYLPAISR